LTPVFADNIPILTSGCLLGMCCRYDGEERGSPFIKTLARSLQVIPFCPEQLGGLPTPRPSSNIIGGDGQDVLDGNARVVNSEGLDVTEPFIRGANEALKLAHLYNAKIAILKDKSPSCGVTTLYCEKPDGKGMGVTAAIFKSAGIQMIEVSSGGSFSEEEFAVIIEGAQRG